MLPRMLAIASLRQTSRLRRHTGMKRRESSGGRKTLAVISVPFHFRDRSISIPELAPGQLDEQILEVRRPVQIAHAGARGEVGEQRRGVARVAERRLARD